MHKKIKQSEITFMEALSIVDHFSPIKIIFNNCVLYNDYDDEYAVAKTERDEEIFGELQPPMEVVPSRLYRHDEYVVTNIQIEVVQQHHSIVTITGYHDPKRCKNDC